MVQIREETIEVDVSNAESKADRIPDVSDRRDQRALLFSKLLISRNERMFKS